MPQPTKLMAPPTSYKMGFVHTPGESSREDEDLAIIRASRLNPILTKSNLWPLLAELTHSNPLLFLLSNFSKHTPLSPFLKPKIPQLQQSRTQR